MRAQASVLPHPRRKRWQPLRSGFVNMYRYDREEFHYENGRVLLRGNNGTGKSRVLALQLPFLLDGDVDPVRLEPDADPSKKVEWNLLMGRYPDRTGYTWIEFGRYEEDGQEHFLTIGCGLSAVEGQTGVRQWFFVTSQRVGKDLELVSDSKQVLGKDLLRSKIGSSGRVFESVGAYRRAVNEALFRLDEYRYASLVNLLIQLRRPQLTRRLEEHELSRALSEALPPVSPTLIASLAEAFRDLEADRGRLDSSRAALSAVEQFLTGYRSYAEVAAKRRGDRVLRAHDEYESAMKEILTAEAECDRSLAELARLKAEAQRLSVEEHALEAEVAAFQDGSRMKDAQAVEQARREAAERRRDFESAVAELADASRNRKSCNEEHQHLNAILEQRQRRLAAALKAAEQAVPAAGLEDVHLNTLASPDIHGADQLPLQEARSRIDNAIQTQLEKVEHARSLDERLASARSELRRAGVERDQLTGLLDDARERLNAAHEEHQASITSFLGATSNWTADLSELPLPFDEVFLRSVGDWCDRPQGPNPFIIAGRKAVDELTVRFAERRAYLRQLERTQSEQVALLEKEQENLTSLESLDEAQRQRLMELQTAIAEAHSRLDPIIDSIEEIDRREGILRSEAHSAPPDEGVRDAYDYSVAVSRHTDSLRKRLSEAEQYVGQKQSQVDQITESRDRDLTDLGIGRWADNPRALRDGIVQYRLALSSLWPAFESLQDAQTATRSAWTNVEHAVAREGRLREIANHLERRAVAAEIARDAAVRAVDHSFGEILERVARARERLDAIRIEQKEAMRRYHEMEVAVTRVDERLRGRTEVLNGETDRRETAASALRSFASTGLLELATPGLSGNDARQWSTARTVEVAIELTSRLAAIDSGDTAWEYQQKSVSSQFTTLMQALSAQGCESSAAFTDDVFVATAVFAGQARPIGELRQILFDDVASRQMLLDARTKEILENHLVGKVSSHLRDLLHAAEEQVRHMNNELESRPMSTGMKLRFVWRPADVVPAGMAEARQRLMQLNDAWSPAERQLLGTFLHQQIQAVSADIEGASWQESLAEALDYRKWHWFGVERYQEGVWKRLTHRTFGTGSGGEKAVALTLPHFAAAAAFYRTADPLAPRLILLDEAFVGIDADMRAKCMGLIDCFDLDFMMTSEREWGCYQTLSGMAIYQLSTRPGIDAIGMTRWVWNGRQRSLLDNVKSTEGAGESNAKEMPDEAREGSDLVTVE